MEQAGCSKKALESLQKAEESLKTLVEAAVEIGEHVKMVDTLPQALEMNKDPLWRPSLIAKMRLKASEIESRIAEITDSELLPSISQLEENGKEGTKMSTSFAADLTTFLAFYKEVVSIATEDPTRRSRNIRGRSFEEERALKRLTNDLKINA